MAEPSKGGKDAAKPAHAGGEKIKRGTAVVNGPNGPNVDHKLVQPGDVVTFRVDVTNKGNRDSVQAEIWDVLPPNVACTEVSAISNGGVCGAKTALPGKVVVSWTGIAIAHNSSVELDYDVLVKKDTFAPNEDLVNTAGVRQYTTTTNVGTTFTYVPRSNIDPTNTPTNTSSASDPSDVFLAGDLVAKTRTTAVAEPGNHGPGDPLDDQATIGENVLYTVSATLPANTVLNAGTITDPLPSGLVLDPATVVAKLDGAALPAGWSVTSSASVITIALPASVVVGPKNRIVTLTFSGRVADIPANVAGTVIDNTASMQWTDSQGKPQSSNVAKVSNTRSCLPKKSGSGSSCMGLLSPLRCRLIQR